MTIPANVFGSLTMPGSDPNLQRGEHVVVEWWVWEGDEKVCRTADGWLGDIDRETVSIYPTPEFDLPLELSSPAVYDTTQVTVHRMFHPARQ